MWEGFANSLILGRMPVAGMVALRTVHVVGRCVREARQTMFADGTTMCECDSAASTPARSRAARRTSKDGSTHRSRPHLALQTGSC
jgi:hypothetical protein